MLIRATKSWPEVLHGRSPDASTNLAGTIDRILLAIVARPGRSGLDLIGETLFTLDGVANGEKLAAVAARKVARLLRDLDDICVCGQSDIIIDYATRRGARTSRFQQRGSRESLLCSGCCTEE